MTGDLCHIGADLIIRVDVSGDPAAAMEKEQDRVWTFYIGGKDADWNVVILSLIHIFLGCCIPVAGLVLFLVWKDTKPKTAKAAGIGALVSVILGILYYLLVFVGALTFGLLS